MADEVKCGTLQATLPPGGGGFMNSICKINPPKRQIIKVMQIKSTNCMYASPPQDLELRLRD